jgi:hypothetical protein
LNAGGVSIPDTVTGFTASNALSTKGGKFANLSVGEQKSLSRAKNAKLKAIAAAKAKKGK